MKGKAFIGLAVVLVLGLVFFSSLPVLGHEGDEAELRELSDLTGQISFSRPGGYFLKTDEGERYRLILGPPWHLQNIGLRLQKDDRVTVRGFKADYSAFFVTSLSKGSETYEIADPEGFHAGFHGCHVGARRPMMQRREGHYGYGPKSDWD